MRSMFFYCFLNILCAWMVGYDTEDLFLSVSLLLVELGFIVSRLFLFKFFTV